MSAAIILVKVRKCTRCGHPECPFCLNWCDDLSCVCYDQELDRDGYDYLYQYLEDHPHCDVSPNDHGVEVIPHDQWTAQDMRDFAFGSLTVVDRE